MPWLTVAGEHGRVKLRTVPVWSWVVAAGAVLLVAGCLVCWQAQHASPASFGWFSYSPLSTGAGSLPDYLPDVRWGRRMWAGAAAAAVGLAMASSGLGFGLGQRRPGRSWLGGGGS